ncbi:MAG: hypothetical protein V4677_05770 [Bacteroidota bacterium]
MKQLKKIAVLLCLGISNLAISQTKPDSLGLPGDNFDLYGALDAFKKAKTPEELEKALNAKDNDINNLDLDGNGKVDYVKVLDKKEKDGHTLILQTAVSENETQDVAVIEVEKTATENAHVQIVGDEELYGKDYIVEPKDETAKTSGEKKQGVEDDVYSTSDNSDRPVNNNTSYSNNDPNTNVVVNVWGWPSVQYMYAPAYTVWVSPWYWGYYPPWWSPWQPIYWHYHHRRAWHYHHHGFYHRTNFYRSPAIHAYYYGRRTSSGAVRRNRESGFYQKRQMEYKQNTPPAKRYNNMPADRGKPRIRENTPRRNPEISPVKPSREPIKNAPVRDRNNTQPQQPVKTPRQPKQQIDRQPINTPRQNVEPRRQERAPQPRAPQQRSEGGQKRPR